MVTLNFSQVASKKEIEGLILKNKSKLKAAAAKFCHNDMDAEDLVQDSIVKMITKCHQFTSGSVFMAWAYLIIRNTFISSYHKNKRRGGKTVELDHTASYKEVVLIANEGEIEIGMEDLQICINKLEERFRKPLQLFCIGYKYHEIADIIDVPLGTIKNRIHVAYKRLKEMLEELSKENL